MGSLLAAVASYLDARAHEGKWLLRIDDIDTPRTSRKAAQNVLKTLEAHGLHWDGVVTRQSDNRNHYRHALAVLKEKDLVFYCTCSRAQLRGLESYPGTCREICVRPTVPSSVRVRVPAIDISYDDRVQGIVTGDLSERGGDFVVQRKEHIVAYPLAVVVDDEVAGVSDVVRGSDLCENTLAQLYLIEVLGFRRPRYAHIPVLNQRNDVKLSKRDQAVRIENEFAVLNMATSLQLLGLNPPKMNDTESLLGWAVAHWDIDSVPKRPSIDTFMSV